MSLALSLLKFASVQSQAALQLVTIETMSSSSPSENPGSRPPASLNGADWRSSDAKQLMTQDMLDGLVPFDEKIKDIKVLYDTMYAHQPQFADFPFDEARYKSRVSRIQATVKRMKWAALYDKQCLAEARQKYGTPTHDPIGRPVWRGSEAARQLDEDMANNLHKTMKIRELWESKDVYKPFGPERFEKRVDQKKEAAKPYGENPMQTAAKRAKKEKRNKAKTKDRPEISRKGTVNAYNNSG